MAHQRYFSHYLPLSAIKSSISCSLIPTIASPKSSDNSAISFASVKLATAFTIAAARFAGFPDLKIPEPTNTPSAPSCIISAASAGVATPADAALMMQLGAEGVFVGSGIFKSGNPAKRAAAIVKAVANFTDAKLIAELSEDLGEAMVGINEQEIELLMAERGK